MTALAIPSRPVHKPYFTEMVMYIIETLMTSPRTAYVTITPLVRHFSQISRVNFNYLVSLPDADRHRDDERDSRKCQLVMLLSHQCTLRQENGSCESGTDEHLVVGICCYAVMNTSVMFVCFFLFVFLI